MLIALGSSSDPGIVAAVMIHTKHITKIGSGSFIGSDTMLVAPIEIGERTITGAGSVVTKNVPPDSKAIGMPARIKSGGRRKP